MKSAVCVMTYGKITGHVEFREQAGRVKITIDLQRVPPGKHGFHIHTTGDLRDGCMSLCGHYNPHHKSHGDKSSKERHVGDLGNIEADENGNVQQVMYDSLVKISGKYSVIGRSVVIHEKKDDLGKGCNLESLITGNAGKRIACGVIGVVDE